MTAVRGHGVMNLAVGVTAQGCRPHTCPTLDEHESSEVVPPSQHLTEEGTENSDQAIVCLKAKWLTPVSTACPLTHKRTQKEKRPMVCSVRGKLRFPVALKMFPKSWVGIRTERKIVDFREWAVITVRMVMIIEKNNFSRN